MSFNSTQEALFLKQILLFMSVVHIANVPNLAKIGLANIVFSTILWFSELNRKDEVWGYQIILHPKVLFVNISKELLDDNEAKIRMNYDEYFFDN